MDTLRRPMALAEPAREIASEQAIRAAVLTETLRLVRSSDQLDIAIELFDVSIVGTQVTINGPNPLVRLTFGSQHVAEEAFISGAPIPTTGIEHIAAGSSVVVIPISADFELTVAGILDLAADTAVIGGHAADLPFESTVTGLELPRGLLISPSSPTRLLADSAPLTHRDTSEVWTARLERTGAEVPLEFEVIANLSTSDLLPNTIPTAVTRDDLVTNTSTISPLSSSRLWLSSSGAFTDLHGEWATGLARYDHRIAAGRDLHVEVQSLGYLLPFGHRAAITEVAERVLLDDEGGEQTAVMRFSQYLTIIEPTVTTPRAFAQHEGRGLPLTTIDAAASATTEITLVEVADSDGTDIDGVFDLTSAGSDLMVAYVSVDRGGNTVNFELPATFVDDSAAYDTGAGDAPARLIDVTNGETRLGRRQVDLDGSR